MTTAAAAERKTKRRKKAELKARRTTMRMRKLVAKKMASALRVVPIPPRTVCEPKDEDDDRDERRWLDW